ncbi:hypothetical protein [Flavihumibacter sp. UBA7668]|jgi:transcription elongation factor Elf1|uniref:hypothetical protein n=1 Tax=Flavihumibacter sp. UBA7668 TaxID=1946542 RepID=UPI0025C163EC|nr:hypothetical protein [Flavihumibacter sp. UBA7668]
MKDSRFRDENKRLSDFYREIWVHCPACEEKAIASADTVSKTARLVCTQCGHNQECSTGDASSNWIMAAHNFFDAELFLKADFKDSYLFAYNPEHLLYLEKYIAAGLREHHNRTGFTFLEKLPKFYHEAGNRKPLLALIAKLKKKAGIKYTP